MKSLVNQSKTIIFNLIIIIVKSPDLNQENPKLSQLLLTQNFIFLQIGIWKKMPQFCCILANDILSPKGR